MTSILTGTLAGTPAQGGPFDRPQVRVASDNTVTAAPPHGAGSILSEAAQIVEGSRNQQHGDKERSFHAIARMWSAYLQSRKNPEGAIRPQDVAHMMSLMKKMRSEWGAPMRDHFVDDAGYTGIAGEIAIAQMRGGMPEG
jgi:hypothetical protein